MHRTFVLLAAAALAVSLGGCGKPQFSVTGTVKYNGAPLAKPNGLIVFVGPEGTQVSAPIGLDGTYTALKVAAGLNRVAVYYPNPAFTKVARPSGLPSSKNRPSASPQYLTPVQYSSPETSKLTSQVDKATVFDVDLTGPAIR